MNILHIGHSWGGGLTKWIKEFPPIKGGKNLFLNFESGYGGCRNSVFLLSDLSSEKKLSSFEVRDPIHESEITNSDYKRNLEALVEKESIDVVIVSSLIGHSLDVFDLKTPVVYILHDYFGYCPHINITFNDICTSCTNERIKDCFKNNPLERFFKRPSRYWGEYRKSFVDKLTDGHVLLISPDKSVINNLKTLEPRFSKVDIKCIPHGIIHRKKQIFSPVQGQEKIRVLFPFGGIDHKGADIFIRLAKTFHEQAEFFCYGYDSTHSRIIDSLEQQGIINKNYGTIDVEDVEGVLKDISPHVAILPCKVPETFSYTLSEMINFCIPIIATDMGSFRSRINEKIGVLTRPFYEDYEQCLSEFIKEPKMLKRMSEEQLGVPTQTMSDFSREYGEVLSKHIHFVQNTKF